MDRELIIDSKDSTIDIVLLEDKRLVEFHQDKRDNNFSVGDIYYGKIKRIIPGLNAAFVNVGYEKDAFLHYLDLGPQFNSLNKFVTDTVSQKSGNSSLDGFKQEKDIEKTGKIQNVISSGQNILIQIEKEPISTKGPRVSSEISFAGRYIVLIPFSDKISVSQKIKNPQEKSRLKRLVQSIKPNNFGVIIRTQAENRQAPELHSDMNDLVQKWQICCKELVNAKTPKKVLGELDRTSTILRDLLNESFNNIYINDAALFDDAVNMVNSIAPEKKDIVKLHKGKQPIFEHFGVERQIKGSFGKTITMKNGTYLVIEHTEALHVIDVNSGYRVSTDKDQEANATETNIEAAAEIARQLRLRDMGGIIVIDFIDMNDKDNRKKLYETMKEAMKNDRAKHTILPPNRFGLIQLTRQRVRPEMVINTLEKCPACDGSGRTKASIVLTDEIENCIRYLINEQNQSKIKLTLHPYVYAYLTKGLFSIHFRWLIKFKQYIKMVPMSSYHLTEFHFFTKNDDEIKI